MEKFYFAFYSYWNGDDIQDNQTQSQLILSESDGSEENIPLCTLGKV